MRVTVIIPSRNERFLAQTVNDVLAKARGDVEVIPVLDGYWPVPYLASTGITHTINWDDKRIRAIHFGQPQGMRPAINAASQIATGDYLMKLDAHCSVSEGFDLLMREEVDRHTIAVPRRLRLDAENWKVQEVGKPPVDAHYLSYPYTGLPGAGLHGTIWVERARQRSSILIDEEMSSQGSCWFMQRKHFQQRLYPMEAHRYGNFVQEFQELGLKTWLGGGRVIVNKKACYAHLHKGRTYGRGYFISKNEMDAGQRAATDYWMHDRWPERKYNLSWLIERFSPVPGWPEGWEEQIRKELQDGRENHGESDRAPEPGVSEGREQREAPALVGAGRGVQGPSTTDPDAPGSAEAE